MVQPARPADRANPIIGEGYYIDHTQNTSFYSWQTSVRKRFSHSFSGSFHYTWGKALTAGGGGDIGSYYQGDNPIRVQDFFNPRADRGPSTGDVTHYAAAEWIYELPGLRDMQQAWLRQALGGWQLTGVFTGQSGDALYISQSSPLEGSRADYIGGNPVLSDYSKTLRYLNRDAFGRVPVSTVSGLPVRPGNVGVGAVRGPGLWNIDLGIGKEFPIVERVRLRVRADMFNALNHTNLSGLVTEVTNASFGVLRSTRGSRVIQLNARLNW